MILCLIIVNFKMVILSLWVRISIVIYYGKLLSIDNLISVELIRVLFVIGLINVLNLVVIL